MENETGDVVEIGHQFFYQGPVDIPERVQGCPAGGAGDARADSNPDGNSACVLKPERDEGGLWTNQPDVQVVPEARAIEDNRPPTAADVGEGQWTTSWGGREGYV